MPAPGNAGLQRAGIAGSKGFIMNATKADAGGGMVAAMAVAVCLAVTAGAMHTAHAAEPTKRAAAKTWRPSECPPPPEKGLGPSTIKATGPCAFEHKGEADCEAAGDDFLVTAVRATRNKAELLLFVNVERYVGPGKYKAPNDVYVSLKDGSKIYRWWTNRAEVTVGPDSKFVTLHDVQLEPEMMLVGCTGPQTNYQCDGRSEQSGIMETHATVTGNIYCKAGGAKK